MAKIISCSEIDIGDTYDLELDHEDHQYYLANGVLTSNSHATGYSVISFQCAYLLNYFPECWCAAFLDKEPEDRKEKALSLVRSIGYQIQPIDINYSGKNWEIHPENDKILIQPLSSIKGLGDMAVEEILKNRPFYTLENLYLNPNISYSKLNKARFDCLIKSEALNFLIDGINIKNMKHLWHILCDEPLKSKITTTEKLQEKIENYLKSEDFSEEEKIEFLTKLTGKFPINRVIKQDLVINLEKKSIPPISEFDVENDQIVWFVPRNIEIKKTQKGKDYYVVSVTDINSATENIKCWGVDLKKDKILINHPYLCKLDYDPTFGYSTRGVSGKWKLLG